MAIDFVSEISDFDPVSRMTDPKKLFISEIRFHSRGICTRTVRTGTGYANRMLRYTKGVVLNDREMTAEAYRIERVGDKDFLFVEHKSGDYYYGGMTPHWYVFYKVEADTHKA